MASERPVRWGHIDQIDQRCKVGSAAWFARHPQNIRLLSAWRKLHEVLGTHRKVHNTMRPIAPSSNANLKTMLARIRKADGKK